MSICPKNKTSKARRDKRRANWKMGAVNLVKCSKCGALMMPHRVCKACGSYNKRGLIKKLQKFEWSVQFSDCTLFLLQQRSEKVLDFLYRIVYHDTGTKNSPVN